MWSVLEGWGPWAAGAKGLKPVRGGSYRKIEKVTFKGFVGTVL